MLKTCFDAFPDHQNQVLKKKFFNVWSGLKRVFMHLRILPDHQNQVIEKLFFNIWSGSKRVLMHFLTTRIKSLKNYFLTSGVVQNVYLSIFAYFQTSRIKSLENYFLLPQKSLKNYFLTYGVVQNVFLCNSTPPESSP